MAEGMDEGDIVVLKGAAKKRPQSAGIGESAPDWSMKAPKGGAMNPTDSLGNTWAIDTQGKKYIAQTKRGSQGMGDPGAFNASIFAKGHAFTQAPKDDELQGALAGQTMGNFSSIPASNASVMPGSKSIKR
jgi:hypothetical protein